MTSDQLRDMINARPFAPFVMHMADGRNVEVNHPEMIAYTGGPIAAIMKADDRVEIVDLLLVPSIEAKAPSPNKGRSRPRSS
jgi:hypothetical protein